MSFDAKVSESLMLCDKIASRYTGVESVSVCHTFQDIEPKLVAAIKLIDGSIIRVMAQSSSGLISQLDSQIVSCD